MSSAENNARLMNRKRTEGPTIRIFADVYRGKWDDPDGLIVDEVELPDGSTEVRVRSE